VPINDGLVFLGGNIYSVCVSSELIPNVAWAISSMHIEPALFTRARWEPVKFIAAWAGEEPGFHKSNSRLSSFSSVILTDTRIGMVVRKSVIGLALAGLIVLRKTFVYVSWIAT
jgi:hypothetical protein